jgi:hypothetical protein
MIKATKTWDVRCPQALADLFPVRKGYYYKIDREQATAVVKILSATYGIKTPLILNEKPRDGNNGECYFMGGRNGVARYSVLRIHGRGHIKTTFHEWYHHLDWMTNGKYNSNDRQGGPSSLAWQFADRLFDVFRKLKAE